MVYKIFIPILLIISIYLSIDIWNDDKDVKNVEIKPIKILNSNNIKESKITHKLNKNYSNDTEHIIEEQISLNNTIKEKKRKNNIRILQSPLDGIENITIPKEAFYSPVDGMENVTISEEALYSPMDGMENFTISEEALSSPMDGMENFTISDNENKIKSNIEILQSSIDSKNITISKEAFYSPVDGIEDILYSKEDELLSPIDGMENVIISEEVVSSTMDGMENVATLKEELYSPVDNSIE